MVDNKIKIVYIISNIDKAIAFEWIVEKIDKKKFDLFFVLLGSHRSDLEKHLLEHEIPAFAIKFLGKRDYLKTLFKLIFLFRDLKPDGVHCHLFEASLIGLLAAKLSGIKKRLYTRHHATYNWEYNKKGIIYDRYINSLASHIIAISENVQKILIDREGVNPKKVTLIYHGFDLQAFSQKDTNSMEILQHKYNIVGSKPVIGVIARWIEWKGIQFIIPAFNKLLQDYPDALLVLANAKGPFKPEIEELLVQLPKSAYRVIDFENDLFSLYQLFDIYVHTPTNKEIEAFGQTYIEALAAGIPSIFTLSGVASEFISHEKNAMVVPFQDSDSIYRSMRRLIIEKELRKKLTLDGQSDVKLFKLDEMIKKLEELYYN